MLFLFELPASNPYSSVAINGDVSDGQLSQKNDLPVDFVVMAKLNLPVATVFSVESGEP